MAGKTTFKSIFTKGSNTEQITVIEKKITEVILLARNSFNI